ncbi:MAG: DUF5606 domain-containing protein [Tannerellaceae bacterium]|jgi:hypothetical protein|nr:DUF5606 domain-containing protein [Tannerellaceae bacterium]
MLKKILSVSGRGGLYKHISQTKTMLIVESLTADKKRLPIYNREKVVSLSDIAMYTIEEEIPLHVVLTSMKEKENSEKCAIDLSSANNDTLRAYLEEVLPNFDRDRVYPSDIRKLILWYNVLIEFGITDFSPNEKEEENKQTEKVDNP